MGQRIAFGTLAIVGLVVVFELDAGVAIRMGHTADGGASVADLLERGSLLPLLFLGVTTLAARELNRLLVASGAKPCLGLAYILIWAMVLTPWLSAAGWLGSGPSEVEGLYWQIVWMALSAVGMALVVVQRAAPEGSLRDVAATGMMVFYLGFLPSFGLQIRCDRDMPGEQGVWLLLMILLVIKASDIGAYFGGSFLGRHRLAPRISPKKSVEGLFGGILASSLMALAFTHLDWIGQVLGNEPGTAWRLNVAPFFFDGEQRNPGVSLIWRAVLFGVIMSVVGQLGDLLESCFKRDAKIKDSGRVIPRFGGILDLIDSPLLAMPAAWFLLRVWWRSI